MGHLKMMVIDNLRADTLPEYTLRLLILFPLTRLRGKSYLCKKQYEQ
jgi:hypothetical protein